MWGGGSNCPHPPIKFEVQIILPTFSFLLSIVPVLLSNIFMLALIRCSEKIPHNFFKLFCLLPNSAQNYLNMQFCFYNVPSHFHIYLSENYCRMIQICTIYHQFSKLSGGCPQTTPHSIG